jgi:hypothetical protein
MTDDDEKPLTLSRDDLYELAWSKPLRELAKDFGISDVGLAKRCRKLGIPLPGRGYWARFDAGQRPYRPKLPKREPQWQDAKALRVAPAHVDELSTPAGDEPGACEERGEGIAQRIADIAVQPTTSILNALVPVKRSAVHWKHPQRAALAFARGEKSGFLLPLSVSATALDRALLLADTLLCAAVTLGWSIDDPKLRNPDSEADENSETGRPRFGPSVLVEVPKVEPREGCLIVEGEEIAFRIEERFRDEAREPTVAELAREKREWGYHAPRITPVATGHLRVVRFDTYRGYRGPERHSWYDRKGRPVESQLKKILIGFYELSLAIKQRRAEAERAAREHAEQERIRKEREAHQAANARLVKQLETDAGAWHRARYLRLYIRVARRSLGTRAPRARLLDTTVDFLNWADGFVDQLDPLSASPRTDDYQQEHTGYIHSEVDRMKQSFARLLGTDWKEAWKLGEDYSQRSDPEDSWRYSYRNPSVFEITGKDDDTLDDDG